MTKTLKNVKPCFFHISWTITAGTTLQPFLMKVGGCLKFKKKYRRKTEWIWWLPTYCIVYTSDQRSIILQHTFPQVYMSTQIGRQWRLSIIQKVGLLFYYFFIQWELNTVYTLVHWCKSIWLNPSLVQHSRAWRQKHICAPPQSWEFCRVTPQLGLYKTERSYICSWGLSEWKADCPYQSSLLISAAKFSGGVMLVILVFTCWGLPHRERIFR